MPSPSRSIFRKPASAQESLSHWQIWRPSIAAGTTGTSSTSGRGRDDHPARSAARRGGAGRRSRSQPAERAPARGRARSRRAARAARRSTRCGAASRPSARQPVEVGGRQPERLAELADRPARAVGREGGDQRRALVAVALVHREDQLLADVAREVEVDVGHGGHLAVEEAAEREPGRDGIDVREPGQVADDRADRAPRPRPGGSADAASRARAPRRRSRGPSRGSRGAAGRSPTAGGRRSGRSSSRAGSAPACSGVASARSARARRCRAARAGRRPGRRRSGWGSGSRARGQVEPSSVRDHAGRATPPGRRRSARPSRRAAQHVLAVAAPLGLAGLERRAAADRDERVLQRARARAWTCTSFVTTGDAERRGQLAQRRAAGRRRAQYGRGSSTQKRSRPNACGAPARRASGSRDAEPRGAGSR